MDAVNMHDAKTRLSQLVEAVESGAEREIVIARNGRPAARLVPIAPKQRLRFGVAQGRFAAPGLSELNRDEEKIIALFENDGEL